MQNNYFGNKYFSKDELKCKGTGELKLSPGFLGELVWLREVFDRPMVVTSCCRSPEHNKNVGGHPRSLHLTESDYWPAKGTLAIDIATPNEGYRWDLIPLARQLGWSVGHGKGFIHLDKRTHIGLTRAEFDY